MSGSGWIVLLLLGFIAIVVFPWLFCGRTGKTRKIEAGFALHEKKMVSTESKGEIVSVPGSKNAGNENTNTTDEQEGVTEGNIHIPANKERPFRCVNLSLYLIEKEAAELKDNAKQITEMIQEIGKNVSSAIPYIAENKQEQFTQRIADNIFCMNRISELMYDLAKELDSVYEAFFIVD